MNVDLRLSYLPMLFHLFLAHPRTKVLDLVVCEGLSVWGVKKVEEMLDEKKIGHL